MQNNNKGRVFDIQPFSVQDGPGIRTTIFLKGCPLRCPWCHSPESQEFHKQLSWISMRCLGTDACGNCLEVCPENAIERDPEETKSSSGDKRIHLIKIDRELCIDCGLCADVCYPDALYICGEDYTAAEIVNKASEDIPFFQSSGGGITISGGEPLSQPEFTLEVLMKLKDKGIHTAIDTTGFVESNIIKQIIPYTDLFLYDLKHMDSKLHEEIVGVPNEKILRNAQLINKLKGKIQVRIPVIPGINDSDKNIIETAKFCTSIKNSITVIQILPFHDFGETKYPRIGRTDDIFSAPPVPEERIEEIKDILQSYDLEVTVH